MKFWIGLCLVVIIIQWSFGIQYRRQMKKICRQMSFLKKHDSNMLIQTEIRWGNLGELSDQLNELLTKQRKEHQEYLKKEAMIADTYTNLSHDIRTPLTSLDGYFQLLEETSSKEEQKKYLHMIQGRIHSLKEMLEELFLFTKVKNTAYHLELSEVCIDSILKQTIFSYYDEWTQKNIHPEIDFPSHRLYVIGNEAGLRRIFENVIKNGLDHGIHRIWIQMSEDQEHVYLKISNEVQHPEEIDISQVFERFYKADAARSKTSSGLGLSIARELAVRMQAELSAGMEKNEFYIQAMFQRTRYKRSELTDCSD